MSGKQYLKNQLPVILINLLGMLVPLKGSAIFSVHSGASDCIEEPLYLAV